MRPLQLVQRRCTRLRPARTCCMYCTGSSTSLSLTRVPALRSAAITSLRIAAAFGGGSPACKARRRVSFGLAGAGTTQAVHVTRPPASRSS